MPERVPSSEGLGRIRVRKRYFEWMRLSAIANGNTDPLASSWLAGRKADAKNLARARPSCLGGVAGTTWTLQSY